MTINSRSVVGKRCQKRFSHGGWGILKCAINLMLRTGDKKGQLKRRFGDLEAPPSDCAMTFQVKFADNWSGCLCVVLGASLGHSELP